MNDTNFKVKSLNEEINTIVNNNFQVTTNDDSIIENITVSWNDLNDLKNNISNQIVEFVTNVTSITTNLELLKTIKDTERFTRLIDIFYKDLNDYSAKFKAIRVKHEEYTGKITSIEDYEKFNSIAFAYYGLSEELITILTPTITDILVICNNSVNVEEVKSGEVNV